MGITAPRAAIASNLSFIGSSFANSNGRGDIGREEGGGGGWISIDN